MADRKATEPLLMKYADIFHDDEDNDFKSIDVIVHKIETGDAKPISKVPDNISHVLREEMDRQVQKMSDKGVIGQSHSPWQSPVILVLKKSVRNSKVRVCVDYRLLNTFTKFDSYPLPRFEDTDSTFVGSKWFSKVDLYLRFWQINICKQDHQKSALWC
jgi:hypothetical protein